MAEINLSKYGITGTTEIVYNPSYELLFEEETKAELEGFEKGQESELGAVNVMTGIYTGRSPNISHVNGPSPTQLEYAFIIPMLSSNFANGAPAPIGAYAANVVDADVYG